MTSATEDEGRLPPGQVPIKRIMRWGTDHPGIVKIIPDVDLKTWVLVVDGEVEYPLRLSWIDFEKLPMVESVSDFHCVEGWSVLGCKWEGVRFSHMTSLVKPKKDAKHVTFECSDGYTTSLELGELLGGDVLLAAKLNGETLERGLGFPLRLVVPSKYGYKGALWLTGIHFTVKKELGYWEKRGYSDTADVWKNDRFSR